MSRLEPADTIEATVGAPRHATEHLGRAVSAQQRVYVLHSQACIDSGLDLRTCDYSRALDLGIDLGLWEAEIDVPVVLGIDEHEALVPLRRVTEETTVAECPYRPIAGLDIDIDGEVWPGSQYAKHLASPEHAAERILTEAEALARTHVDLHHRGHGADRG